MLVPNPSVAIRGDPKSEYGTPLASNPSSLRVAQAPLTTVSPVGPESECSPTH